MSLPYEHPLWPSVMGRCLHPGGEALSRRLLALCAFPAGARVLDAGCGPGVTLGLLGEGGLDAVGVDRDEKMLGKACLCGQAIRGDLEALPFGDESFDGAVCECVLSQQDRLSGVLGDIARILKPGGVLGVTDLYALDGCDTPRCATGSCRDGAVTAVEMERAFLDRGLQPRFFEDHRKALRECAARLVRAGILEGGRAGSRRLGYGLWICRKR